ncbi:unnamed protein product [Prunus armeniaca]
MSESEEASEYVCSEEESSQTDSFVEGLIEARMGVHEGEMAGPSVESGSEAYRKMQKKYKVLEANVDRVLALAHTPEVGSSNQTSPSESVGIAMVSASEGVDIRFERSLPFGKEAKTILKLSHGFGSGPVWLKCGAGFHSWASAGGGEFGAGELELGAGLLKFHGAGLGRLGALRAFSWFEGLGSKEGEGAWCSRRIGAGSASLRWFEQTSKAWWQGVVKLSTAGPLELGRHHVTRCLEDLELELKFGAGSLNVPFQFFVSCLVSSMLLLHGPCRSARPVAGYPSLEEGCFGAGYLAVANFRDRDPFRPIVGSSFRGLEFMELGPWCELGLDLHPRGWATRLMRPLKLGHEGTVGKRGAAVAGGLLYFGAGKKIEARLAIWVS